MGAKRRWGDRRDGTLVRDVDGFYAFMPYLMNNRSDAEVYLNFSVDITNTLAFLDGLNKDRDKEGRVNIFHCAIMAAGKVLYHRPKLNRFVSGYRLYERNDIRISFIAKRALSDDADEAMITLKADPGWTVSSVGAETRALVSDGRMANNDIDNSIERFRKLPRSILRILAWSYKKLDFHGMAPRSLTDGNPGYASVLLVNLGSIKCPPVYHHLNNYGTNSLVLTIGVMRAEEGRTYIDLGATVDERIADGFYIAKSMNMFCDILGDPKLLSIALSEKMQ